MVIIHFSISVFLPYVLMKAYIITGGKGNGCLRPITILSLREHVAAIILPLLLQPPRHIHSILCHLHTQPEHVYGHNNHKHAPTVTDTHFFPLFSPFACSILPPPLCKHKEKGSSLLFFIPLVHSLLGLGYGSPGTASAPPRFTIPRHER